MKKREVDKAEMWRGRRKLEEQSNCKRAVRRILQGPDLPNREWHFFRVKLKNSSQF
jgi:hypothetical protein